MKYIEAKSEKLDVLLIEPLQGVNTGRISLEQLRELIDHREKYTINLARKPTAPFAGTEIEEHIGEINGKSFVEIELGSDDNLYVDGKRVSLHLSFRQMDENKIEGDELCLEQENSKNIFMNSNVLDYIYEDPKMFPEHWKENEREEIPYIFFPESKFRDPSDNNIYIRCIYWNIDKPDYCYRSIGRKWCRRFPSACIEIN